MDKKMVAAIAVVVVVVIAAVAVFALNSGKSSDSLSYFDGVGLKALGNVDKDNDIDQDDYNAVKKLIDDGASAKDNKLADANNDGTLDNKDLFVIDGIIKGDKTIMWHVNYHDTNGDGTMDKELVSTAVPVTSTIMTGSANNFIMFDLLGIEAETTVKGACYGSTNDSFLYKNTYLNTSKVERLGTLSYEIPFEDGKIGSSDIIKEKNVTCLVTDWNRIYITNEDSFEAAGVDVVRIAAASFDKEVYTHSISLLGLVFDQEDQAKTILSIYDQTKDEITTAISALKADQIKKAVASSTTAAVSSADSDYTAVIEAAGAEFALKGYDFGGSSVIYVKDNLEIFDTRKYQIDNIVHIRTALTYGSETKDIAKSWAEFANGMSLWEHAYDGQVLISGSIPVPARVAYASYAMYNDVAPSLSEQWAKSILSSFEEHYTADVSKAKNHTLGLTSYEYEVTVADDVIVKKSTGEEIKSGDKFAYGTILTIAAREVDPSKTLVASGSTITDGKFAVVNTINAQYIENTVLEALNKAADKMVELYDGKTYMQSTVANAERPGSLTITNDSYNLGTTRTCTIGFEYYDTVEEAQAAYIEYTKTPESKIDPSKYWEFDDSKIVTDDNEICIVYSGSHTDGKDYTGSTLYMTAYYKNIVLAYSTYVSHYTFDTKFHTMTPQEIQEYFAGEVATYAQALEDAMKAAFA
ncbi:MAG: hypothetical protein IKQ93_06630 [Candidatus Methanomethylophilaceae archaeon]|nr:hypothetical protein [Candidatus Methanomethylophilaceae archaeon]MBR6910408.1 hypothetical protein [Candidatus Methanomethylophilaceae archaeon]